MRRLTRTILILFSFLLIFIIVFFMYGIQMLIKFSLFIEKIGGEKKSTTNAIHSSYVSPPIINPMPEATNSAQIIVGGYSLPYNTVRLYVNDRLAKSEKVSGDREFRFQGVTLREGKNRLKAKAVTEEGKESSYSEDTIIVYITKAPSLIIDSPSDGQTFSGSDNQIKVTGTTESNAKITINDFWAIVDDEGKFSYLLGLQKGENHLKIVSTDPAGNKTTKELKTTLND